MRSRKLCANRLINIDLAYGSVIFPRIEIFRGVAMNNKYKKQLFFAALLFGLTACGGGNNNSEDGEKVESVGFSASDVEDQVFITKGNFRSPSSFTFFSKDQTGIEFLGGDFSKKGLTWEIKDKKLNVTINGGGDEYSIARTKLINGNKIEDRRDGQTVFLYRPLPLTLADLDGKILKFDLSNLKDEDNRRGCIKRTLRVDKNKAYLKEVCNKVSPNTILVEQKVEMHGEFKNTVKFTRPDGDTILMALISGDLKTSVEVTLVYQGQFKDVQDEKISIVGVEAF